MITGLQSILEQAFFEAVICLPSFVELISSCLKFISSIILNNFCRKNIFQFVLNI